MDDYWDDDVDVWDADDFIEDWSDCPFCGGTGDDEFGNECQECFGEGVV